MDDIDRFFDALGPDHPLQGLREAAKKVPPPTPEEEERMERRFHAALDVMAEEEEKRRAAEEQARAEQARAEVRAPSRSRRPQAPTRTLSLGMMLLLVAIIAVVGGIVVVALHDKSSDRDGLRVEPPDRSMYGAPDPVRPQAPDAGAPSP